MPSIENRVINLEKVLADYIRNVGNAQMQTEKELREFKEEMREFKEEMREFKEEMGEDRKKAFKQWGEIANKMGTLAEDIIAPSIREIAEKYFGCKEEEDFMVRRFKRKKKDKGKRKEFDILSVYDDAVILVEVKSTPRMQYINDFLSVLNELYDYFPEYREKRIIPIFASLFLPDDVIECLRRNNIYAMATKEDMMDLMNFKEI